MVTLIHQKLIISLLPGTKDYNDIFHIMLQNRKSECKFENKALYQIFLINGYKFVCLALFFEHDKI
jgi:hypothetical protein